MPAGIMVNFEIEEIASVDRPAMGPALASLMKSKHPKSKRRKRKMDKDQLEFDGMEKNNGTAVVLTDEAAGHGHAIWIFPGDRGGETSGAISIDSDVTHWHGWAFDANGNIQVVANENHSHFVDPEALMLALLGAASTLKAAGGPADEIEAIEKFMKEIDMAGKADDKTTKKNDEPTEEMKTLKASNERLGKIVALSVIEKAHFDGIEEAADQDGFLALDKAGQTAAIQTAEDLAKADDPIEYTATDGTNYLKSHDPLLVNLARKADTLDKKLLASESLRKADEFEKTGAKQFPNMAGTPAQKGALARALDGITDETVRKAVTDGIMGADKSMKALFETVGHVDGQVRKSVDGNPGGSAHDQLTALGKALMAKSDKPMTKEAAFARACDENPELATQAIAEG